MRVLVLDNYQRSPVHLIELGVLKHSAMKTLQWMNVCERKKVTTYSFCWRYSENILLHSEATHFANLLNKVKIGSVLRLRLLTSDELCIKVMETAWKHKVSGSIARSVRQDTMNIGIALFNKVLLKHLQTMFLNFYNASVYMFILMDVFKANSPPPQ